MSDDIKEGDWVIVVKKYSCCGNGNLGNVLIARKAAFCGVICPYCKDRSYGLNFEDETGHAYLAYRLKKIPPLSDDESTETSNDLYIPMKEVV